MSVPTAFAGALAGLVCLVPVTLAPPAEATENLTTLTSLNFYVYVPLDDDGASGTVPYEDGDPVPYQSEFEFGVAVQASDGSMPMQGGGTVQIRTKTNPDWSDLISFTDWREVGGYHYYSPDGSAEYRFAYTGYVAKSPSENNFAPSVSMPVAINVSRAIKAKTHGQRAVGTVSRNYKNLKVKVLLKHGKKYVAFGKVKTNQKSRFTVRLPAGDPGKRLRFRLYIPGNDRFVPTVKDEVLRY